MTLRPITATLSQIALLFIALNWPTDCAAGIELDSAFESDPEIRLPERVRSLAPDVKRLWYEVLNSDESELTMRAAEAIAKSHHYELDDLSDAMPPLRKALQRENQPLAVRMAIVRALIVIDARDAAPDLAKQARRGEREMCQLVEPALAEWNDKSIQPEWLDRLTDDTVRFELRQLAVRGLGACRNAEALAPLKTLAKSRKTPAPLRIEAARAISQIASTGQESFAAELATDKTPSGMVDRLVAAAVLAQHRSDETTSMLTQLALDDEPAVAAIALKTLLDTDPKLVEPLAGELLANADANVRRLAAQSLFEVPSPAAVVSLGPLLDDPHPDVRQYVRDSLFTLAGQSELDQPVRKAGMKVLGEESWRGHEQASLLLGALDHEPAADRLLELLNSPRAEVMVASAWGLRKLALKETLDPILSFATRRADAMLKGNLTPGYTEQLSQAFQMFGQMDYKAAEPLMRKFIPKEPPLGDPARMGAIWALGHFHAGKPDESLVGALQERVLDVASMNPESEEVRGMSAISLGRMKSESSVETLRNSYAPHGAAAYAGAACNWAITQITGETFPEAPTVVVNETNWFLVPLVTPTTTETGDR